MLTDDGPVLADLLLDLREVFAWLIECVRLDQSLDGFLFAAGAAQIIEDHLQRDPLSLRRSAKRVAGLAARPMLATADAADAVRAILPSRRRTLEWLALVVACGTCWLTGSSGAARTETGSGSPHDVAQLQNLLGGSHTAGGGSSAVAVVFPRPRPAPIRRYRAGRGVRADAEPSRAGRSDDSWVRTLGSYSGPLVAAALRAEGIAAAIGSTRPGHPLLPGHAEALAGVMSRGGHVALIDDPPNTGGSLRDSAALLESYGVARDAITMLMPLFGGGAPAALEHYRRIELPFDRWAIHQQLSPRAIEGTMRTFWRKHFECDEVLAKVYSHDRAAVDSEPAEVGGAGQRRHVTSVVSALSSVPGPNVSLWCPVQASDT